MLEVKERKGVTVKERDSEDFSLAVGGSAEASVVASVMRCVRRRTLQPCLLSLLSLLGILIQTFAAAAAAVSCRVKNAMAMSWMCSGAGSCERLPRRALTPSAR